MSIFDLEENFVFYASYHHDTWNKFIHILCVWPILWTGLVFAEYVPYEWTTAPTILSTFHPVNLTFVLVVIYASFYILFDQKAGTMAAFLLFLCLVTSRKFFLTAESSYGYPAWAIALAIHIAGWVAQFFGHGHFEGRAPALLDNLVQAFLMAPFFVFLEVLFMFGYRKDFQNKVEKIVMKNIAEFKRQKQTVVRPSGPVVVLRARGNELPSCPDHDHQNRPTRPRHASHRRLNYLFHTTLLFTMLVQKATQT